MAGKYATIGDRRTYFPPFVNERFDGPPWWACTFTALLNGVNVGFLGAKPATHEEVDRLARASGDDELKSGSRSSHMITALERRYGITARIEHIDVAHAKHRLKTGWAMVAGLTYGALPDHYRRWSPRFQKGHRVTVLGLHDDRTRLLDPLANKDEGWTGEWIPWAQFERAWWPREQLWFKEGQFVSRPKVEVIRTFDPPRKFRIAAGSRIRGFTSEAGGAIRETTFESNSAGRYDALVRISQTVPGTQPEGTFLRAISGFFQGCYVSDAAPGVTADTSEAPVGAATGATSTTTGAAPTLDIEAIVGAASDVVTRARQFEYDRIRDALGPGVTLPDRPADD